MACGFDRFRLDRDKTDRSDLVCYRCSHWMSDPLNDRKVTVNRGIHVPSSESFPISDLVCRPREQRQPAIRSLSYLRSRFTTSEQCLACLQVSQQFESGLYSPPLDESFTGQFSHTLRHCVCRKRSWNHTPVSVNSGRE
jgi:hypothetical protein